MIFTITFIALIQLCYGSGTTPTTTEVRYYPRIFARAVHSSDISFYLVKEQIALRYPVKMPTSLQGNWTRSDNLARRMAEFFSKMSLFYPTPFDRISDKGTNKLQLLLQTLPSYYKYDRGQEEGSGMDPDDVKEIPLLNENDEVETLTRTKRELSFECSNMLSRLWYEHINGGVCAEGVSADVKEALEASIRQQQLDKQAMNTTRTIISTLTKDEFSIEKQLSQLTHLVESETKNFKEFEEDEVKFRKTIYKIIAHMASESAVIQQLNQVSELIRGAGAGFLSIYDFPSIVRSRILSSAIPTALRKELAQGSRLITNAKFWFGLSPPAGVDYDFNFEATLPMVNAECRLYDMEMIGLEVNGKCLTGPDIRGAVIIDCDSTTPWVTSRKCLDQCDWSRKGHYICHGTDCSGNTRYQPDWLRSQAEGELVATNLRSPRACALQPTVMRVGENQFVLVREANVTMWIKGKKGVPKELSAGTLLKTACEQRLWVEVEGKFYKPSTCNPSNSPIQGRLAFTVNSTLTLFDLENIEDINFEENGTFGDEIERLVQALDTKSLTERLHERQKTYRELGIELNADLTDMSVVQHEMAEHVAKISKEASVSLIFKDRIIMTVIGIVATASLFMSLLSLCSFRAINSIPIRNIKAKKRLCNSIEEGLSLVDISQSVKPSAPTSPPDYRRDYRGFIGNGTVDDYPEQKKQMEISWKWHGNLDGNE